MARQQAASTQDVLAFWFGELGEDGAWDNAQQAIWFGGGKELDEALTQRFGAQLEALSRGELDHWADEGPRGKLALILLCDQLSRNVWRGSARAFSLDAKSLALANQLVESGQDQALHPIERVFVYLPFEHAESMAAQDQSVALFEALTHQAPEAQRELFRGFLDYAHQHRDIIVRFGRYPHRNAVLGRESTQEETAFLANGPRFGQ